MPNLLDHLALSSMPGAITPYSYTRKAIRSRLRADERLWTPLGSEQPAYFSDIRRSRAITLSRQLSLSSPLYQRILSATVDTVVPHGLQLFKPGDFPLELMPQLDWIWFSGPSSLLANARRLAISLFIDGELLLSTRANPADGRLTLTDLRPERIRAMKRSEGISVVSSVTISPDTLGTLTNNNVQDEEHEVIRRSPDGILDGDIFYFRMMPAGFTVGLRGLPLFIASLDDVASTTELIYNRITRLGRLGTHYWDVTLTGATQDIIDEFLASDNAVPPESGEVFGHNEQVAWNLIDTQYEDQWRELKFVMDYISGTSGLSPEFVGHSPGRDVTTESIFSALQHLQVLQSDILSVLETIIEYSISVAAKRLGISIPKTFPRISMRDVASRLVQRQASSFESYINAITSAIEANIMDREQAALIIQNIMRRFGVVPEMPESEAFIRGVDTNHRERDGVARIL